MRWANLIAATAIILAVSACGKKPVDRSKLETAAAATAEGRKETFTAYKNAEGGLVRHGKYQCNYADGKKADTGSYVDGERNGPWQGWYADGLQRSSGNYIMGKPDGVWTTWHGSSGAVDAATGSPMPHTVQKETEGSYRNGLEDGGWKWWYVNGALMQEGNYVKGRKDGKWTYYNNAGVKIKEDVYKNGKLVEK